MDPFNLKPVKVAVASQDVDKLLPGVLLVEGELHGTLERVAQKPEVEEPGRGQGQQVVGRRRKLVPNERRIKMSHHRD